MVESQIKKKPRSFKRSEHINEKGDGPYCFVFVFFAI